MYIYSFLLFLTYFDMLNFPKGSQKNGDSPFCSGYRNFGVDQHNDLDFLHDQYLKIPWMIISIYDSIGIEG